MEILVALGEIFGAKSLIDVGSVQVAGVSYHNLGDAGLEFLDSLVRMAE
jgi:predicted aconitase